MSDAARRPVSEDGPRKRPSASVIVPFLGSEDQLAGLLDMLGRLRLRPGDELIVADNRPAASTRAQGAVRILAAQGRRSPGFARNRGAAAANGQWLVFIDADTVPGADLLERYFDPPPLESTAALAGGIDDVAGPGGGIAARHSVARAHMSQQHVLARGRWAYAQSANIALRRSAFVAAGGFAEDARAGEDADLCFRLRAAGWGLEQRPTARVWHLARGGVWQLLAQLARHGAGAAWCQARHPGSFPPPRPTLLARRLGSDARQALLAAARGDREAGALALLDVLGALAFESGRLIGNRVG